MGFAIVQRSARSIGEALQGIVISGCDAFDCGGCCLELAEARLTPHSKPEALWE
jgi:hypothetical protein